VLPTHDLMIGPSRFGDQQLERLYRVQQSFQNSTLILHAISVLVAAFLLLAVNHLFKPDLALLLGLIGASTGIGFQIFLYKGNFDTKLTVTNCSVIWLFCIVIGIIPAGGQSSLIPSIIAHFLLYTFYSYDLPNAIILATLLSVIQIIGFILWPVQAFTIHQLLATLLVHAWCHFIGIYLYITRERLCRAAFLNARNALSQTESSKKESEKMGKLLSAALPDHVIAAVRNQLGVNVPQLYIENYNETTVSYARLYGLENLLSQISVQDAARLLNEFNTKIDQLVKRNNLVRIQSDAIVVVSGIPEQTDTHAEAACQFAWELIHVLRSFCDATTAELYIKIGVAIGSVSAGIVGANKWHYEIIGDALDIAMKMEQKANPGCIILSNKTAEAVKLTYGSEKFDDTSSRLIPTARVASTIPNTILFPNHRRFSLSTIPQAINRLLVVSTVTPVAGHKSDSMVISINAGEKTLLQGRRKKKLIDFSDEKVDYIEDSSEIINPWTLTFRDMEIEKSFNMVIDRWFIPALAISIFFLVVYGLYQVLVMPRLIASLALIIVTLAAMFIILLMLYVNHFETFCYFITRTSIGHAISILIIITLLFICGIVNVFSCPPYNISPVCHDVFYSIISCVLWMLATTVFIRYSSFCLFFTLIGGIAVYCIQIFLTHSDLYIHYSILVEWRIEYDLLIALITFALVIYFQARRNERIIRLDFLSLLRSMEEACHLERYERINEQILINALPHHIAYNYLHRTDPYIHLCYSVGVLSIKIGHHSEWNGETGINRLNQIIYQIDRLLETYLGLEKVRSSHCIYTAVVGVLPEITRNIHDTPFTIGDLLASLTSFAINLKQLIEDEGLEVAMGIDCGSAFSVVIGGECPRYEIIGLPCNRAIQLMENASEYGIIVSEEIYLALRPRNFNFDHKNSISVGTRLTGYIFADALALKQLKFKKPPKLHEVSCGRSMDDSESAIHVHEETTQCTSVPMDQSSLSCPPHDPQHFVPAIPANATAIGVTAHNPLEMFTSMNSSMSSDMYSIDVSVESDSEIEWITPESIIYEKLQGKQGPSTANNNMSPTSLNRRFWPSSKSISYKGDRAKQYSDFSENDREPSLNLSGKMRRRRFKPSLSRNGPRIPNWLNSKSSINSELSLQHSREGSVSALDRLNAAARRVDKMLLELAHVDGINGNLPEKPFPTNFSGLNTSTRSIDLDNRRELSSACHTEYDNAESEGACSDPEMATSSRLEELKHVLRGFSNREKPNEDKRKQSTERFFQRRFNRPYDPGNEADIDSNCSSVASSTMLDKIRWKSVHSIGYENEYEYASDIDEHSVSSKLLPSACREPKTKSVGDDTNFLPMDASDSENEIQPTVTQNEVTALTQDIYKNFGEYQLATFSDMDASG
jgi:class 3 adenylate cyclase